MCRVTMNVQPLDLDAEFTAASEFGKPLVNSLYTLGLMIGMSRTGRARRRGTTPTR